jgi:hypothetical protein
MMEDVIKAVCALHCPEAVKQGMVYEVWEDGEVTLTKGGELYGMRNLHMIQAGNPGKTLPPDALPIKSSTGHSRIWAKDVKDANQACKLIQGPCPWNHETGDWLI